MTNVRWDPNRPKRKSRYASTTALDRADQDISTWKDSIAAKERFDKQVKSAKAGMSAFDVDPYKASVPPKKQLDKPTAAVSKPVDSSPKVNTPRPKGAASTADSGAGTAFAKQYADNQIAQGLKDLAAKETRYRGNDTYKNVHDFGGDTSLGESPSKPVVQSKALEKKSTVVKAAPVVKAKAPVAREVLVNRLTGAKYDMAKMRDAYEDLGYAKEYKNRPASTRFATPEKLSAGAGTDFAKRAKLGNEGKSISSFAKGGSVKLSAPSRGDGCATKGKTKGRFV